MPGETETPPQLPPDHRSATLPPEVAAESDVDPTALLRALPAPPDPALDAYLDAAARCFARHGLSKTTVPDIAAESGVTRSTIYRLVGNVQDAAMLLLARELYRFFIRVPGLFIGRSGPEAILEVVATFVEDALANPVLSKIMRDEPAQFAQNVVGTLPELVAQEVEILAPILDATMRVGILPTQDPRILADWLLRLVGSLLLIPPPDDLRDYLRTVALPVLATGEPTGASPGAPRGAGNGPV